MNILGFLKILFLALIAIYLILLVIGIFLPLHRVETYTSTYNSSPKDVYEALVDNTNWQHRRGLKGLILKSREGDIETWDEVQKNGQVISFKTIEKRPYSYYSIKMSGPIFEGVWFAELIEVDSQTTELRATENIKIKHPIIRLLSYLFLDLKKQMISFQNDLQDKLSAPPKEA